jgi:hypothetical protein
VDCRWDERELEEAMMDGLLRWALDEMAVEQKVELSRLLYVDVGE